MTNKKLRARTLNLCCEALKHRFAKIDGTELAEIGVFNCAFMVIARALAGAGSRTPPLPDEDFSFLAGGHISPRRVRMSRNELVKLKKIKATHCGNKGMIYEILDGPVTAKLKDKVAQFLLENGPNVPDWIVRDAADPRGVSKIRRIRKQIEREKRQA